MPNDKAKPVSTINPNDPDAQRKKKKKRAPWAEGLPDNIHAMPSVEALPLISKALKGRVIAQFSGGKDSVGCVLELRKYFTDIELVFFYMFPGLRIQEEALQYYERLWGQRIIRVAHPFCWWYLRMAAWQPWHRALAISEFGLEWFDYNPVLREVKIDLNWPADTPAAIGVRAVDSIFRKWTVGKMGTYNPNHNILYPIWDRDQAWLVNLLTETKTKLSAEYRIMGRSFDGLDYRFVGPLKQYYPDDYEKVKEVFPFIDAELLRYQLARERAHEALTEGALLP